MCVRERERERERENERERERARERQRAREKKTEIGDWREESALVGTQKAMDDESRESVFVMNGR